MPLQLKKRHTRRCQQNSGKSEWDHSLTKCKCPYFAEGTLAVDGYIRLSTREGTLEKAEAKKRDWETRGTAQAPCSPPPPEPSPDPTDTHTTLEKAQAEFEAGYMEAKRLQPGTRRGYRTMLKFLSAYAQHQGIRFVDEFDGAHVQDWQQTWHLLPTSAAKRFELAACFFGFCVERGWISRNPISRIHKPRVQINQKAPFSEEELQNILRAAREYPTRNTQIEGPRLEAIALLMLFCGPRISDAAFFNIKDMDSRNRWTYFPIKGNQGGNVRVRSITVEIPDSVAAKLRALPASSDGFLFATGRGAVRTVTDVWSKKFQRVFARAEELMKRPFTSSPHPHRFRHTFAIRFLLTRVGSVQDVTDALGHSDPRITLRHYRRWVPGLQDNLCSTMRTAFERDPLLTPEPSRIRSGTVVQWPVAVSK
jgi:integrase